MKGKVQQNLKWRQWERGVKGGGRGGRRRWAEGEEKMDGEGEDGDGQEVRWQ